ncbi:hypothetical protein BB559_007025 [Furculomyces boomerangus]|uniref:Uncharacterized protein n=1 Tax=Furculomyces boomerangus TaxID=61424 RepID=A0A2T9XZA1_9FUNG|nr:hypothetical protein BB559_007025 [Furculomyces boomerangus]
MEPNNRSTIGGRPFQATSALYFDLCHGWQILKAWNLGSQRRCSWMDPSTQLQTQTCVSISFIYQESTPSTKRGFFKSCRINMGIKLNTHTAKKEKQLLEARQQVIDFSSIGIHIKELSRGFSQIKNPSKSKVRIVAEEIYSVSKISPGLP